jgi:ribosomal protein L40E
VTPLLVGTALALAALAFVLYPLFREPLGVQPRARRVPRAGITTAVDALREIEFDHATGKLSDRDYAELKATYTQRAVDAMRAGDGVATVPVCTRCGPRPEPDAVFCSECGAALPA